MTYEEIRAADPRTDDEIILANPNIFVYKSAPGNRGLWIVQYDATGRIIGWSAGGSTTWVRKPSDLRGIAEQIRIGTLVLREKKDVVLVLGAARVEWELAGIA